MRSSDNTTGHCGKIVFYSLEMEKRLYSFMDLEKMDQDEFDRFIEDIPPDNESINSDVDGEMQEDFTANTIPETGELFDTENMEMILENGTNYMSDWDEEDNIPLSSMKNKIRDSLVYWTNDESYVTQQNVFKEDTGPNLPDNAQSYNSNTANLRVNNVGDIMSLGINAYSSKCTDTIMVIIRPLVIWSAARDLQTPFSHTGRILEWVLINWFERKVYVSDRIHKLPYHVEKSPKKLT
ncbi:hypothetical protein FQA39_LY19021 [Lamprigera yunnana]|nr:hypothetical protein FQA39_LY19021 [Lamprigera yunnana]